MTMSMQLAQPCLDGALPCAAKDFYLFDTDGPHLLVVDGSQIFKIDACLAGQLAQTRGDNQAAREVLTEHGLGLKRFIGDEPFIDPPMRALSLAVAERCN